MTMDKGIESNPLTLTLSQRERKLVSPIKAGVIGHPIAHSLSPRIHNFWLKKYGINGTYEAIDVKPEELGNFIRDLAKNGYAGINVTIPHKERVFKLLESHSNAYLARTVEAANTVFMENNKFYCKNTDGVGFLKNLLEQTENSNVNLMPEKVFILGAGGAARPIIHELSMFLSGPPHFCIINRTKERAESLKLLVYENSPLVNLEVSIIDWEDRNEALKDAGMLVNATSLGMKGQPSLDIDLSLLPKDALVADIVYNPLETTLLKHARLRGNSVVDGIGMLLYQAVPGFKAWFGVEPEVTDELREYVLDGLKI